MRCACHTCGEYMVHSESLTLGCVCPSCGRRCTDCLGTNTLLSKEDFKKLAEDPLFAQNFGANAFFIKPAGHDDKPEIYNEPTREEDMYGD